MNKGGIVWLTGIPASGKTTIAEILASRIRRTGGRAEILDGDDVRKVISKGLTFSREDRKENVRRIAWIARKMAKNDVWALVAAVSPYAEDREEARAEAQKEGLYFLEVNTKCSTQVAEHRDSKGLYKNARAGAIHGVTGVDAPYEESPSAFVVDTAEDSAEEAAAKVWDVLLWRSEVNPPVVCIGRGHTGTRLIAKLMQDLGIYIGQHEQINGCEDSMEWVRLIYQMVEECGPVSEFKIGSFYKSDIRNNARNILKNGFVAPGAAWGWKLPETTLVMPFFVDAFPEIKFVHCVRHPVSSTLRASHQTANPFTPLGSAAVAGAYAYCGRNADLVPDDEEWLRSAITWQHQTTRAMKYGRTLGQDRYMEMKYEDICANPDWALSTLERFTKLRRVRSRGSLDIDEARMNKWDKEDPRAAKIWEICGKTAGELGYTFLEGFKEASK